MSTWKRALKKADVLRMLTEMESVVKKLPDSVVYKRFFLVDDGKGIILESGIQDAAQALGRTVETMNISGEINFLVIPFCSGGLQIYQEKERNRK